MNPRTLRVLSGFLVAFVLLSLAPRLPDLPALTSTLVAGAPALLLRVNQRLSGIATDDLLLGVAALLCALLLARGRQAPPVVPRPRRRPGTAQGRPSASLAPAARPETLGAQIRSAARNGAGVPALARQHRLSQDAIRTAIGPAASSAGLPGSSFRPRKPLTAAAAAARPAVARRTPYRAPA